MSLINVCNYSYYNKSGEKVEAIIKGKIAGKIACALIDEGELDPVLVGNSFKKVAQIFDATIKEINNHLQENKTANQEACEHLKKRYHALMEEVKVFRAIDNLHNSIYDSESENSSQPALILELERFIQKKGVFHISALKKALQKNLLVVAEYICKQGMNLSKLTVYENDLLATHTMKNSMLDSCVQFKEQGLNYKFIDNEGKTLLHWCTEHNYIEGVKFLLKSEVSINSKDNKGNTPLHNVDNFEIFKEMVKLGANP